MKQKKIGIFSISLLVACTVVAKYAYTTNELSNTTVNYLYFTDVDAFCQAPDPGEVPVIPTYNAKMENDKGQRSEGNSNTDKNKAGNETEASGKVWGVGGSTKGEVSSEEDNTTTTTNTIPILYHHIACSAGPGPYLECYDTQFHEVKNDSTTGKWTCCNGLNNLPKKY